MENESDKFTETGFRERIITNFSELKKHLLTQCKETKNIGKRFNKMLMRINSLEKNINDLMEPKNTRIVQAEERISEVKVQLNEIKCEEKIREKRIKRMSKVSKKCGTM